MSQFEMLFNNFTLLIKVVLGIRCGYYIRFFRFNNFERNRRHSKDFYGGDISSSSEVMPHGIGSELEPEILRMDQQNPWQPALPLNPHAQPEPAIPHAAQAPAPAEVPHDAPHPNFYPNPMVGGESLSQIYLRLLLTNKERAQPSSDKLFDKASSIFESKTLILHKMEALDPGGLSGGAKFIKNRRAYARRSCWGLAESTESWRREPLFSLFSLQKR